ncbi:MAG: DUF4198 domain-containing protein [Aliishimia sp.]
MTCVARILAPVFALAFNIVAGPSFAHEFWISPEQYQVDPGATIKASFRNGENFEGSALAFFDRTSKRLEVVTSQGIQKLTPRNGNRPAIVVPEAREGLVVLAHETSRSSLTYRTWEKFLKFAAHKDFKDIEARHDERALPRENFRESYSRHVKSLVAVGHGEGSDRELGLNTEFVALTNPYNPSFTQNMQVNLFYNGGLRPDVQVEIFEKAPSGDVVISLTRTNANGMAEFVTKPGHSYLIDAVVLREPQADVEKYAWETLWAAMTFAVPD